MRIRDIENSWWVEKVFITKKRIYLINSFFENNISYVCYINLDDFFPLIKKTKVIRHHVMCPPFITNNSMICGLSNTNMNISITISNEVINIVEIGDTTYLQYISCEKIKTIVIDDNNVNNISDQSLDDFENKIIKQRYNLVYKFDTERNQLLYKDKIILDTIKIIKFVIFKDCVIILDNKYSLYIYKENKLKLIKKNNDKANIFWINDNNFLLTSLIENKTYIYNIYTLEFNILANEYFLIFTASEKFALSRTGRKIGNLFEVSNGLIIVD